MKLAARLVLIPALFLAAVIASSEAIIYPAVIRPGGSCSSSDLDAVVSDITADVQQLLSSESPCGVGWRLAVSLDMGDPSQQCPSPWVESVTPNRSCFSESCVGITFPVSGQIYSQVCGRAVGYGVGLPDAFLTGSGGNINAYLDGVSVTHGLLRQHIWSFANGHGAPFHRCPCNNPDRNVAPLPPAFVGDNYFCDGNYNGALWDGMDCTSPCCTFNSPPWFNVTLPTSTADGIEVRICSDEGFTDEATYIRLLEFYVK